MPSAKNKVQPQNISHEHELDSKGVYQLANGAWAYRFCKSINGKNVYKRASTDRKGNPLLTQRDAMLAREEAMLEAQGVYAPVVSTLGIVYRPSATIEEVYEDYCANGRGDRSHNTIKRQDTLWRTYLKADFGKKRFNGISLGEIQDYLANKYYVEGYSYRYVESFLKMFYLFFGQAYSRNYIPAELYNQFCVNKETKIRMPKIKRDEDLSIVSFTDEECAVMDEYFKGTHAETAYLLGRYCGLRINECYGLKWENVDLEKGTISIEQQMGTQDGLIKLFPLKTRNARRVLYLNKILLQHLKQMYALRKEAEVRLAAQRQQNQTIIIDMNGEPLSCLEMVNTLPEGKIQTVNSMKYHSKVLKDKHGINFKYRYKDDIKCISPWAVIYDNNFYYLLAYDGKKMRVYRIDHMEGVEVEEAEAEGLEEFKKIKLSDYTKQTFGMYSGELQSVTMRFPNNMVGTVLDRFGREVTLMKADDRHFRITVPIAVSPQFYGWVFGLKNMVTIESPQSVVDGMKEMLAAVEKRYEDSKGSQ